MSDEAAAGGGEQPPAETEKKKVQLPVHPDARKSLTELRNEWVTCRACSLGERREAVNGAFVFGEGSLRGIMFIGEGPDRDEEAAGRPFVGEAGRRILRRVLNQLGIEDSYITNIVTCRPCKPMTDAAGNPILSKGYRGNPPEVRYVDQPPIKPQIEACRPRLMEEIYLVDPVVIVSLGRVATTALTGSSVAITREHGIATTIAVPGASQSPALTGKKVWIRKQHGVLTAPMKQNVVRYPLVPTYDPALVLRQANDFSRDNPFKTFYNDIREALDIYNRYQLEVHGIVYGELSREIPYDLLEDPDGES